MGRKSVSFLLPSLTAIVILLLDLTFAQHDTCKDNKCCQKGGPGGVAGGYSEIDNPRRSILSEWKSGQNAICDRALTWGWYRFVSYVGEKMPEKKVDTKHCGTIHPIWMNGKHPTKAEGTVDREACVNFYDLKKGCFSKLNMKVRYCDPYHVYYLGPTYSCSLAYCAGESINVSYLFKNIYIFDIYIISIC